MVRIPISVFDRHVHLSQIDAEKLFGKWYQFGKETLVLQWSRWTLENVKIILPFRKFTQVEISFGEADILGVESIVRSSGNLKWTPWIKIIWPAWVIAIPFGVIVAQRHLHCTVKEAQDMGLKNGDIIKMRVWWWGYVFDNVIVRAKDIYVLDFHLNSEEADAVGVMNWDWWEII